VTAKRKEIKGIQPPGQAELDNKDIMVVKEADTTPMVARRGRPKGAKNKDTLFKELMTGKFQDIAVEHVEKTIAVLFQKAHQGDMKAIKLIMDRVVPVTKAVDLADMEKKGLTINISVGSMEDAQAEGAIIEDADYTEVDEYGNS
jgi:hypothetical protein